MNYSFIIYIFVTIVCNRTLAWRGYGMRKALPVAVSTSIATSFACSAFAMGVGGTVNVGKLQLPTSGQAALYLTAREDENAFVTGIKAVKKPPLLTTRIPLSQISFPYEFSLDFDKDATEEGTLWKNGAVLNKDLVIAARIDTDGVAATRDSQDLVGRAKFTAKGDNSFNKAEITMSDRGIGGKFVTQKN
jgi:hypothetical protein